MTNKLALRSTEIDPEFAAIYEAAGVQGRPNGSSAKADSGRVPSEPSTEISGSHGNVVSAPSAEEDEFQRYARMAKEHEANSIDRKKLAPEDQIEHDLTRTLKLGWDILTS